MKRETLVPAIPDLRNDNIKDVVAALKSTIDVREGRVGDPLDSNVTLRELQGGGLIGVAVVGRGGGSGSVVISPAPGLGSGGGTAPEPDLTPPPQPTGLSASAGIAVIVLEWSQWSYGNHAYTEIWRSSTNVIGNAVLVGTSDTRFYNDAIGQTGVQYYYWIRFRSQADVTGPYQGTNGVSATTGKIGNVDLGPLIVEAANLANGTVSTSKLASDAITAGVFAPGYEPVTQVSGSTVPTTKSTNTIFLIGTGKLYRWNGTAYTKDVVAADVDSRGLNVKAEDGSVVFGANGFIGNSAYLTVDGNNVSLSDLAASQLVPNLNFVGAFSSPPTQTQLGSKWLQNAVYRNTTDGYLYVLTGSPLDWVLYLEDGVSFVLTVESTNGTTFRVGQNTSTLLKGRLFKNGAEVTDVTPAAWFRWRRVSAIPQAAPNDDATWNASYQTGYKQVSISVDSVYARATFFCDIIST
jgi:hypothetical protein